MGWRPDESLTAERAEARAGTPLPDVLFAFGPPDSSRMPPQGCESVAHDGPLLPDRSGSGVPSTPLHRICTPRVPLATPKVGETISVATCSWNNHAKLHWAKPGIDGLAPITACGKTVGRGVQFWELHEVILASPFYDFLRPGVQE